MMGPEKSRHRALVHHYANRPKRLLAMREYAKSYNLSPRRKYADQRQSAKRRGIKWSLTFEQWLEFWGLDYSRRGNGPDDLCMARIGDMGPYALGNIIKLPGRNNSADGSRKRWGNA